MFISLFMRGRVSLSFLPKTISAGESLDIGSGVFLLMSTARRKVSVSKEPSESILSSISRFMDFTANSALPFDCG